jgi:hypothetical protein
MAEAEKFFDAIDTARIQRVKEISEVKRMFVSTSAADPLSISSKAVVVLIYATWEGFYNECVRVYLDFLEEVGTKVADASWLMLIGALNGEFDALRNRNHSTEARKEFVAQLKDRLACRFDTFDRSVVLARSNLDFSRLSSNFAILGFDYSALERSRIRLDKELVGWRHGVAHGDAPDLSAMNVSDHADFAVELMLAVSGLFQNAILERLGP